MFTLRGIATLDIAQRRVRFDDARANQVVQAKEILVMAHAIEVAAAERQGAEVFGNGIEQRFCGGDAESDLGCVCLFAVV